MFQCIFSILLVLCIGMGCSSPEPPEEFLYANMRIAGYEDEDGETKLLRMKPVDLYNTFDINVTKKWKKHHENSWKLIIKGKDPSSKRKSTIVFTFSVDHLSDSDVIIKEVIANNRTYPGMIADIVLKLDEAFDSRNPKNSREQRDLEQ